MVLKNNKSGVIFFDKIIKKILSSFIYGERNLFLGSTVYDLQSTVNGQQLPFGFADTACRVPTVDC